MPAPVSATAHVVARSGFGRVRREPGRVQMNVTQADAQRAALRHGVAGVDAEIHEHLMQLGGDAGHLPGTGPGLDAALDIAGKDVGDDAAHLADEHVEVDHGLSRFAAAGKGEHLLDHVRAAARAGFNHLKEFVRFGREVLGAKDMKAHDDRSERVVEVVGDAADEDAEGFEALRAQELFFELFPLGDVRVDHEQGFGSIPFVADEGEPGLHGDRAAVTGALDEFAGPFALLVGGARGVGE